MPADLKVQEADRLGVPVYDHVPELKRAAKNITEAISEISKV